MKAFTWKEGALIAVCLVVFAAFVAYLWNERNVTARSEKVMNGSVRANETTKIYHVPTCPQYESIGPSNIKNFKTVASAEASGYRASMNCLAEIKHRRNMETGEYDDSVADVAPVDPRQ